MALLWLIRILVLWVAWCKARNEGGGFSVAEAEKFNVALFLDALGSIADAIHTSIMYCISTRGMGSRRRI